MGLTGDQKIQLLGKAWIEQTGELRKCSNKVESFRVWKQRALELQNRYDEVVEINP